MGRCAKTKFIGDASDWSIDKLVDLTIDPPIEYEPNIYDSKMSRAENNNLTRLCWDAWTDIESGTCDYNSDSFIKFLNYCNEADKVEYDYSDYKDPYEGMSEEEKQAMWKEMEIKLNRAFLDDTDLFEYVDIGSHRSYVDTFRGKFGGAEMTFIEKSKIRPVFGAMAINANSDKKDMAWEFIRSYFDIECYRNANYNDERGYSGTLGFPITKEGMEYDLSFAEKDHQNYSAIDDPDWKDYDGFAYIVDYDDYSKNIKLGSLTEEDIAAVDEIINSAVPSQVIDLRDSSYYEIGREELLRFFNGGCTAEQCADALQSRLSIYLSEKYST